MNKKYIVFLEIWALFFMLCSGSATPMVAQADTTQESESVHIWDGTADTGWYDTTSETEIWYLSTPEQVAGLAKLVNEEGISFEGETIEITEEMHLNESANYEQWEENPPANAWTPIGTSSSPFLGTLEGNCHGIYGIYINKPYGDNQGFIGYAKNINIGGIVIRESYINGRNNVGAIVGNLYADGKEDDIGVISGEVVLERCANEGIVKNKKQDGSYAGGLIGCGKGMIRFCKCYMTGIVEGGNYVGGFMGGALINDESLCGCQMVDDLAHNYVYGEIKGEDNVGIIVGRLDDEENYSVTYLYKNLYTDFVTYDVGCIGEDGIVLDNLYQGTKYTEKYLEDGTVAYIMGLGQNIGEDFYPTFGKEDYLVYKMEFKLPWIESGVVEGEYRTIDSLTQYHNKGDLLDEPEWNGSNPLAGWYRWSGSVWNFATDTVERDFTLYARYKEEASPTPTSTPTISPTPKVSPASTATSSPKPVAAKKIKTFVKKGIRYKVKKQSGKKGTVKVQKVKKAKKVMKIPATVTYKKVTYKVVTVGKSAFAKKKKIRKVIIGKNVTSIERKAFYKAKKLRFVDIRTKKLRKVGKKAFKGIYSSAKIKVPKSQKKKYVKLLRGKY